MGCAGSRFIFIKESPLSQALERKLVEAIISAKQKKALVTKKSSFNNLMLQLPKLTSGFKTIREAHAAICGPSGKITWEKFRSSCKDKLGIQSTSGSLDKLLSLPDVADGVLVSHADLIVIFTVIFLIDGCERKHSIASQEIRGCLDLMEKSFMFFDSSADGCIERKELALAMKSGTRVFGRKASKTLADQLFDQLDWSKDGQITFKEYLIGMERIIIETAGDEDEDDLADQQVDDLQEKDDDIEEEQADMKRAGGEPMQAQQHAPQEMEFKMVDATGDGVSALGALANSQAGAEDEVRRFTVSGNGAA